MIIFATIGLIIIGIALAAGPVMSDVETPKYDVIQSTGSVEIRTYNPMIIAEVHTQGPRDQAIQEGFRLLADYIFGNNTVRQNIAMTAPVQQQRNTTIAMTSPVQQQSAGQAWKVSFIVPSEYSLATLPEPNNRRVMLKQVLAKSFVTIRFSGRITEQNLQNQEQNLRNHVRTHKLAVIEPPKYAFYNPPWTLPLLRRNEIMLEISP